MPSWKVYETDEVIAILDILPIRLGHTLVIPKVHYSRVSELPSDYAGAVGAAVSKVAHALTEALDHTALNIVCNQEYAQAVPHVHYHIIPAPKFGAAEVKGVAPIVPLTEKEMHMKEFEAREELDDDDAKLLVEKIAAKL